MSSQVVPAAVSHGHRETAVARGLAVGATEGEK